MPQPTVLYTQLTYEDYKRMEEQMKMFRETVHPTVTGYHHKSIRIQLSPHLIHEYHGPLVGGEANVSGGLNAEVFTVPTRI